MKRIVLAAALLSGCQAMEERKELVNTYLSCQEKRDTLEHIERKAHKTYQSFHYLLSTHQYEDSLRESRLALQSLVEYELGVRELKELAFCVSHPTTFEAYYLTEKNVFSNKLRDTLRYQKEVIEFITVMEEAVAQDNPTEYLRLKKVIPPKPRELPTI